MPARHAPRFVLTASLLCLAASGCGGGEATLIQPATVSRVEISPAASFTLLSGANSTLTARALSSTGQVISGQSISWTSSDPSIATVVDGLVTGVLVGTASISAGTSGVASPSVLVTVSPGPASQLAIKVQPAGAASQAPFITQPVIEMCDAAGNVVTSGTASVSADVATGGGTLTGTLSTTAVRGVAAFTSLALGGVVGVRTLTFSSPGLASATSAPVAMVAGAPRALAVRTQPVAGTAYASFTTPAAIDVRDADGNLATFASPVSASIASGGGALGGTVSLSPQAGVATFADLMIAGAAGPRTLAFSAAGLTSVTTVTFDVAAAPPAVLTLTPTTATIAGFTGRTSAPVTVQVTNTGVFPLTNLRVVSISYGAAQPSGWLTAGFSTSTAPSTLSLIATAPSTPGTYTATMLLAGDGTATASVSLPVTLTVQQAVVNAFGTSSTRTSLLDIGASVSPGVVTTAAGVPATDASLAFVARSPSVATVDPTGKITGLGEGESWVVATSQKALSDSVFVIVKRNATGPVLYVDLTKYDFRLGDTVSARVLLDLRGASGMGALTATVAWSRISSTNTFNPLAFIDFSTASSSVSPSTIVDVSSGVIRISAASATGAHGVVELGRIRFIANQPGGAWIYISATELLAADFSNLLPSTTLTQFPVTIR